MVVLFAAACAATPPAPHATLAITGARVFDGERLLPKATVLVDGNRIVAVGPEVAAPPGVETVDGSGKTLLPGLIDAHTHVWDGAQLEQALVFGVTTVLDMFTLPEVLKTLRADPRPERADIRSAGVLATAPGGHGTQYGFPTPTLTRPDEAQAWVDARLAEGSDYVKIVIEDGSAVGAKRPTLSRETVAALCKAAHARGKLAVVHVTSLDSARLALEVGADGLVHIFADVMPPPDFGSGVAGHRAFVVPTLGVLRSVFGKANGLETDEALAPFLAPDARANLTATFRLRGKGPADAAAAFAAVRQLNDAGVPILAGTDAPNPGTTHGASLHGELALFVEAGLTPVQALAAATSTPARVFGLADRGQIAPGRRADLVLVDGDPSSDITATRRIAGVWRGGVKLDREAVRAKLAAAAAAPPSVGLVSDFSDATPTTKFGQPWTGSTDSIFGGASTVALSVDAGALRIAGEVVAGKVPASWAGAMFSPGGVPFAPADLSKAKGLSFRARGDGKTYVVMVFTRKRGRAPSVQTFTPGKSFAGVELPWSAFDGSDGSDVTGILIASTAPGRFELVVDDVEIR
jgi:imidazolonepropionase-like amidohydrolase